VQENKVHSKQIYDIQFRIVIWFTVSIRWMKLRGLCRRLRRRNPDTSTLSSFSVLSALDIRLHDGLSLGNRNTDLTLLRKTTRSKQSKVLHVVYVFSFKDLFRFLFTIVKFECSHITISAYKSICCRTYATFAKLDYLVDFSYRL
jgi:hypothetical protein